MTEDRKTSTVPDGCVLPFEMKKDELRERLSP